MCGTLILSYISRFRPFLEIQNFELHWGVISINLGLFKVNVQIWKMFLGSLKFEYVLGMPDFPYILGGKE